MRAVEDGGTARGECGYRLEQALARLGIDADGGLVEEQHARAVEDAAAEVQAAPHADREAGDRLASAALEPDQAQHVRRAARGLARRKPEGAGEEAQVLAGRQRRVEGHLLWHEAELAARPGRCCGQRVIGDRDVAGVEGEEGRENRERRRFSGAVRAEETDDLARPDGEPHAIERDACAVTLAEAVD